MSELTTIQASTGRFNRNLLATASIAALMAFGISKSTAEAADTFLSDSDRPSFWIELGGDFQRIGGEADRWMPPAHIPFSGAGLGIRKDASGSFGMEGKVSYQFGDTPWLVMAGARYGRAQRQERFHTQYQTSNSGRAAQVSNYNATTRHTENHLVVDFQIGRDFGLGLQGKFGNAVVGAGVRIAQFSLDSEDFASSQPYTGCCQRRMYDETMRFERRTSAMGPAISLSASTPLISNDDGGLMFDWGASGAVLFGRQKVMSQGISHYVYRALGTPIIQSTGTSNSSRAKSVVIPNIGAFAGMSYRLPAAKVAIGYRADLYFDGIDGGLSTAKKINRSFYGPFATISFGLGG